LVMSRDQDPVAKIGWDLTGADRKKTKQPDKRSE